MLLQNINKYNYEENRDYVFRIIKSNIMNFYLKPNQKISEPEVANFLSLSRTPVREAFILLENQKFLNIFPKKGTFVSHIDLNLVSEAIFFRNTMEKAVIKSACNDFSLDDLNKLKENFYLQKSLMQVADSSYLLFSLDNEFHKIVFNGVNKNYIWDLLMNINSHYNRLRVLDTLERINVSNILNQHRELISIIENKRISKVDSFVDRHLTNVMPKLELLKEKYPDFFKSIS